MNNYSPKKGIRRVDLRSQASSKYRGEIEFRKTEIRNANKLLEGYFKHCGFDKQGKDAEIFRRIILSHIKGETNFILEGGFSVTRLEGHYTHERDSKKPIISHSGSPSNSPPPNPYFLTTQHSYKLITTSQEDIRR